MQKQKGFTIIELIVVIAIIAVLATIVMINVTSYIGKSKDASIKGNMSTIASTAAGFYDDNKAYTNLVNNTTVLNAWAQINSLSSDGNNKVFANTTGNWCACAKLTGNSSNTYCADSQGYRGESSTACTRCNTTNFVCGS